MSKSCLVVHVDVPLCPAVGEVVPWHLQHVPHQDEQPLHHQLLVLRPFAGIRLEQRRELGREHLPQGLVDEGLLVLLPVRLQLEVVVPHDLVLRQLLPEEQQLRVGEVDHEPEHHVEELLVVLGVVPEERHQVGLDNLDLAEGAPDLVGVIVASELEDRSG